MRIGGLQKVTLIDYPGKVAATIFTQGCNFRCPYCHNPELVLPEHFSTPMSTDDLFSFLVSRRDKLEAVCITGGEPTVHADLPEMLFRIKQLGYQVKLDSNGSRPDVLEAIITAGTADYIAMDIKAPLEKYPRVAGMPTSLVKQVEKSISLIMESGVDYEFRTTVMHPLLSLPDFEKIGNLIAGATRYYLQNYQESKSIPGMSLTPFSATELVESALVMEQYVGEVGIR